MEKVRHPAAAGQFYPSDPGVLLQTIDWCYRHPFGPGRAPAVAPGPFEGVVGFVVPHAGYRYSGPIAAHAFRRIAELGLPTVAVILGPNHYGAGRSLALSAWEQWEIPLGSLPVDVELGESLAARVPGLAPDAEAHRLEHSLEVQLPFLFGLYGPSLPVLPVAMADQSLETARLLGHELARALEGRSAVVLASSDFSHYLPDPEARREDKYAITAINSLDPQKVEELVRRRGISMCGYGPVMAMLMALRELNAADARLLAYGTSGDTSGDFSSVVGYAAVAIEGATQPSVRR